MNPAPAIYRPILARHARYRWDSLRQQHQLVYPEGVLVLNESGAAIIRHCDGRPIGQVVAALEAEFNEAPLPNDVPAFLARLFERGLLMEKPENVNDENIDIGRNHE